MALAEDAVWGAKERSAGGGGFTPYLADLMSLNVILTARHAFGRL